MTDWLFYNGTILPQDAPSAEAVAVRAGRIVAVGRLADCEAAVSSSTPRYDLAGRTLIPGFNDAHVHVWKVGHLLTTMLDVRGVRSLPEMAAQMRDFMADAPPERWFMGRGYNEAVLEEKRRPTRHDLDAVFPDRPAYLIRTCAHIVTVNTRALELAGISADTEPPPGGIIEREADGTPNGILHETAQGLVFKIIPPPTAADYEAMLAAAARHQLSLGITSATDPGVLPELMAVYRSLDTRHALPVRMNVMAIRRPDGGTDTLPLPERHISDRLRVDSIKFFADGGLSGATSALSVNYRGMDSRGVIRFEHGELLELSREAHLAGLRIGIHAIGDVTIDRVLSVYEDLAKLGAGQRHRIEHFGLPSPDHFRRAARAGVIVVPQAVFIHSLGPNFRRYLPDEFLPRCYPVRDMLDAGLTVALSSDAPVVKDDNPLLGMQAAILRRDFEGETIAPAQSITAQEALYAYTMGGAMASGDADNRGSLTVGKWADMAVLSDNPLTTAPEALTDLRVQMTLVGGEIAYEGA